MDFYSNINCSWPKYFRIKCLVFYALDSAHVFMIHAIFTARRYASAGYAMVVCLSVRLSVCLSVCLSQVGVLLKWLIIGTRKQHRTIAQGL